MTCHGRGGRWFARPWRQRRPPHLWWKVTSRYSVERQLRVRHCSAPTHGDHTRLHLWRIQGAARDICPNSRHTTLSFGACMNKANHSLSGRTQHAKIWICRHPRGAYAGAEFVFTSKLPALNHRNWHFVLPARVNRNVRGRHPRDSSQQHLLPNQLWGVRRQGLHLAKRRRLLW